LAPVALTCELGFMKCSGAASYVLQAVRLRDKDWIRILSTKVCVHFGKNYEAHWFQFWLIQCMWASPTEFSKWRRFLPQTRRRTAARAAANEDDSGTSSPTWTEMAL
jgi:hypothetical protein